MTSAARAGKRATGRFASLDGLRGVAAIIVVFTHFLVVVPDVSDYIVGKQEPLPGEPTWWLVHTPLRVLLLGNEAVMVFFIMSGFVLMLPMLGRPQTIRGTLAYYARRSLRLYLPVWGSLVLAVGLSLLVPRDPDFGSSWLATHSEPTLPGVIKDAVLVLGVTNLNSPLWSLTWEVWFSLFLPLFVWIFRVARVDRWWLLAAPLLVLASAASQLDVVRELLPGAWLTVPLLRYMPVFLLGMILAARLDTLHRWSRALTRGAWTVVILATVVLLLLPPILGPARFGTDTESAGYWFMTITGACLVVLLALLHRGFSRSLERPVSSWLGARSFSLYLVHEPIIVSAALLVGASTWWPWLLWMPVVLAIILLATTTFFSAVERPAHRIARWAGVRVGGTART